MAKRKVMDADAVATLRTQLKALLPAFETFLNEEAAEPAHADPVTQPGAPGAEPTDAVAVAPVADPAVAAADPDAVAADPEAPGGGDLMALLPQLKALIAQIEAAASDPAADPNADPGPTDPDPSTDAEGADPMAATAAKDPATDAVQGLAEEENTHKLDIDNVKNEGPVGNNNGMASPGPGAGTHTGADAALRAVYADTAAKTKLADRLSKVVGAFDGAMDIATATSADVAAYGIKKLKLKAPKGQEAVALDAYLSGVEAARRAAPVAAAARAADAASPVPVIDAYFKE